ncbi:hypothetical protein JCGZ_24144 [Jatropha curcas]|uniref:Aminotransferase-like plant mobile domain-containing protein n=1 Tax=Jatropha curcas TaxID=180498 RepID=A0A067L5E7_JATCU|nr:hypothetical protein JCGZ_24144 [Jatropha curcas]
MTASAPPIAGHRVLGSARDQRDARFLDRVVSRNCSVEEQFRDATVDLGKARAGGSSTDDSMFWDLLGPPMQSRVITASFDIWTRGSGESNWQFLRPLKVWAYEYWIYPGGPGGDASVDTLRIPRHLAHYHHTFSSFEDPHYWRCYLNDRALSDRIYELQVATAQRRVPDAPPRHMCLLKGMTPEDREEEYIVSPADIPLSAGDYAIYFSTRLQARLPEVREYIQDRKKHRTPAYYRAQAEAEAEAEVTAPAGPAGAVLGDVPFPPGMEVALDPTLRLGSAIIIPADLRQAPPLLQLDPEHATHISACSEIPRALPEMEVDRLRTRLEVEGIPLVCFDDKEDDDDGSSSDDALLSPPAQAAAGPSWRRR